jgi:hypothetical protein
MMHMPQFGSCQVTRAADPLILNSAARTRCPVDLVGDADHTLPGREGRDSRPQSERKPVVAPGKEEQSWRL